MKKVPLCLPAFGEEEMKAVAEVLRSGWLAHGPKNKEFEAQFCEYLGVEHAISMNSCTTALYAALQALEVRGEVIAPSFTFVATVNSILLAGATPVLVDVDESATLDPARVEEAITDATEAIMVVHYGGLPADMPAIIRIAGRHGLRIIEDSAECLGGTYHGTQAGAHDIGCFSFFPTKNITTGEGGMLTTNDAAVAKRVRRLCGHGIDSTTYEREKAEKPWLRIATDPGFNFRLSNALAAIGVEQMKKIDRLNQARTSIAVRYRERLDALPSVTCAAPPEGFESSWQMFTLRVDPALRDGLLHHLRDAGIEASVHFEPAVHEMPNYRQLRGADALPVTEAIARSILSLPIYPDMNVDEVETVCRAVESFAALA